MKKKKNASKTQKGSKPFRLDPCFRRSHNTINVGTGSAIFYTASAFAL